MTTCELKGLKQLLDDIGDTDSKGV